MLGGPLIDLFIHRSRRNIVVDTYGAAVSALIDDELLNCSSGLVISSSVFWVSSLVLPSVLFNRYRPSFAARSAAAPSWPPWPALSSDPAIIGLACTSNRCVVMWGA